MTKQKTSRQTIILAGGCFWCTEAVFQQRDGIAEVVSGYAGGSPEHATYEKVASGTTKHREAVKVTYNPEIISLEKILSIYWSHIDPTDDGGQFADRGFQYTPAIFYTSQEQKEIIEQSKKKLEESKLLNTPIAVKIIPSTTFFPAEEHHQQYALKKPDHYHAYAQGSGRADFTSTFWSQNDAQAFLSHDTTQEKDPALDELSHYVLKENGTEKPFANKYWNNHDEGIYVDILTGAPLFSSTHKYDSGTGWPSFYKALDEKNIIRKGDDTHGMSRTEVCSQSGHLGHVFNDGPADKGGQRFCMNSAALRFIPKDKMREEGYGEYLDLFKNT